MKYVYGLLRLLAACTSLALAPVAHAQAEFPTKPMRLIVPGPPGGSTDIIARLVGDRMAEILGQPVLVDNRPGATSIVSMQALTTYPADGHTLLLVYTSHVVNPLVVPNNPFDPLKDFAPVATLSAGAQIFTIANSVPANNFKEFVAYAKANPGKLNYASPGVGSINGLATQFIGDLAGVKMQEVAYKGAAPILVDLIAGRVHVYLGTAASVLPQVKGGKIRAIAVDNETRLPLLPDVPTLAESGVPGVNMKIWFGLVALPATPKPIIDKLNTTINRILALPEVVAKLEALGSQPVISTPAQFDALMRSDMAKYRKVVDSAKPASK